MINSNNNVTLSYYEEQQKPQSKYKSRNAKKETSQSFNFGRHVVSKGQKLSDNKSRLQLNFDEFLKKRTTDRQIGPASNQSLQLTAGFDMAVINEQRQRLFSP